MKIYLYCYTIHAISLNLWKDLKSKNMSNNIYFLNNYVKIVIVDT